MNRPIRLRRSGFVLEIECCQWKRYGLSHLFRREGPANHCSTLVGPRARDGIDEDQVVSCSWRSAGGMTLQVVTSSAHERTPLVCPSERLAVEVVGHFKPAATGMAIVSLHPGFEVCMSKHRGEFHVVIDERRENLHEQVGRFRAHHLPSRGGGRLKQLDVTFALHAAGGTGGRFSFIARPNPHHCITGSICECATGCASIATWICRVRSKRGSRSRRRNIFGSATGRPDALWPECGRSRLAGFGASV